MPTVIDEYLDNGSDESATRYALQELLGDITLVIPTLIFSKYLQGKPAFATFPAFPVVSQVT
jgi:carboxylesterase 3/5